MQTNTVLDAAIIVMSPIGICLTAKYMAMLFITPTTERAINHNRIPRGKISSLLKYHRQEFVHIG